MKGTMEKIERKKKGDTEKKKGDRLADKKRSPSSKSKYLMSPTFTKKPF